ncbi:MAG: hypothetical protein IJ929_05175 [Prevotella sp.]|nr:hypothetical protein [Prevotella sp.]
MLATGQLAEGGEYDVDFDHQFEWDYWTRGVTRGASNDGTAFKASGEFAK